MNSKTILLTLFLVFCFSAFCQEGQEGRSENRHQSGGEKGLIKVSVLYPYVEGKKFDFEYYQNKHMPMVANLLGKNLVKYTIEKGLASGIPNTALPYISIGVFYVRKLSDYEEAIGKHRPAIRADIPNYTDITPIILISEVVR